MATEFRFDGGFAVGKTSWHTGFSNGVKIRTFAENNSCEIEIVGRFDSVTQPRSGELVPSAYSVYLPAVQESGNVWAVQNSTLTGEPGGDLAVLHITCVQTAGINGAFDTSWDIDMQEVQRSIKQHPAVLKDKEALSLIKLWEQTPESIRFDGTDFWYYKIVNGEPDNTLTKITNSVAINCLKAMTAGIESYNVYLPVVTKTTRYIAPMTGQVFPYDGHLGTFDIPAVRPSGYNGTNTWFKSADKYSRANNGTWVRTEQWTYTDDTTHSWIYTKLSNFS